jgi:hypothetical protein
MAKRERKDTPLRMLQRMIQDLIDEQPCKGITIMLPEDSPSEQNAVRALEDAPAALEPFE